MIALTTVVVDIVMGKHDLAQLSGTWGAGSVYGVLQSAVLMFFAFAGYARHRDDG